MNFQAVDAEICSISIFEEGLELVPAPHFVYNSSK